MEYLYANHHGQSLPRCSSCIIIVVWCAIIITSRMRGFAREADKQRDGDREGGWDIPQRFLLIALNLVKNTLCDLEMLTTNWTCQKRYRFNTKHRKRSRSTLFTHFSRTVPASAVQQPPGTALAGYKDHTAIYFIPRTLVNNTETTLSNKLAQKQRQCSTWWRMSEELTWKPKEMGAILFINKHLKTLIIKPKQDWCSLKN